MNRDRRSTKGPLPPPPIRRFTEPCGCHKRRFRTEAEAQAAALRVSRHVGPLRVYRCPRKAGYHLTRLREWKDRT